MYFSSLKLKFFRTILNMYSMTNTIITCTNIKCQPINAQHVLKGTHLRHFNDRWSIARSFAHHVLPEAWFTDTVYHWTRQIRGLYLPVHVGHVCTGFRPIQRASWHYQTLRLNWDAKTYTGVKRSK